MRDIEIPTCSRCGQFLREALPGPGHCTCDEARLRVARALPALSRGRRAVIWHADLRAVVPEVATRIVSYSRPSRSTRTVLYFEEVSRG